MKLLESRKEEDAAAGSGQAVASGKVVLPGVCFTMSLLFALCTVQYKDQPCGCLWLASFSLVEGGERYVALFPYTGQYEDELSFEVTSFNYVNDIHCKLKGGHQQCVTKIATRKVYDKTITY